MKAISIKQPWLNAILSGRKTLEIRTWYSYHVGPLLLCASRTPHKNPEYIAPDVTVGNFLRQLPTEPLGAAVATCRMIGCREMVKEDEPNAMCAWNPPHGRVLYAFILADVKRIEQPFPVRGKLGLFDVEYPKPITKEALDAEYRKINAKQFDAELNNVPMPAGQFPKSMCEECGMRERKIGALCLNCAGR